jgi:hypothetical protein
MIESLRIHNYSVYQHVMQLAAIKVAFINPYDCYQCHPQNCRPHHHHHVTTGSNKNKHISHRRNNNAKDPFPPLQPSFYTVEEVIYGQNLLANPRPWLEERGSACFIDMIHPQNKSTSERWNQSCRINFARMP